MAEFRHALERTLKYEGGLSDDPDDAGGLTNKGITLGTYSRYYGDGAEGLRNITDDRVERIYRDGYWDRICGDGMDSQPMAEQVFDTAVNCGVRTASRMLQRLLYVADDGVIGRVTLAALNSHHDIGGLISAYAEERKKYCTSLVERRPSNRKFLKGWLRRAESFKV